MFKKALRFSLPMTAALLLVGSRFGVSPAAAQRPLGIDVSYYQGSEQTPATNISWTKVKTAGVSFTWIRATEGLTYNDPDFARNMTNAIAAGVIAGAYHYADYNLNTTLAGSSNEAVHFWATISNYVKPGTNYLYPMLDVEAATNGFSPTTLTTWLTNWCVVLSNRAAISGLHLKPFIYCSSSHAAAWFTSAITTYPNDIAAWSSSNNPQTGAPSYTPWSTWTGWQYWDAGAVSGVSGNVDQDVFDGTIAQLQANYTIGVLGPVFTVQPTNVTIAGGSNTTFTVAASGSGTIHYQWQFNGTNIVGATSSQYTVTNADFTDVGSYSALAWDNNGTNFYCNDAFLSLTQVLTNAPGAVLAPRSLVNWWTGDGNYVDIIGGTSLVPNGNVTYAPGTNDYAFHFDGTNGYFATGLADIAVPWTLCAWVNRQNSYTNGASLMGDGTNEIKLEQYNGTREVGITVFGVADYLFTNNYTIPANKWTHIAFVGTSTGVTLYVNGVSNAYLGVSIPLPRQYIGCGYAASSGKYVDFLTASVDDMMTYNRALSTAEIASIYGAGASGIICAPFYTAVTNTPAGGFQVAFDGLTSKTFSVYSSTDLNTWTKLTTLTSTYGTNQYTENNFITNAQKFYKVLQP